MKTGTELIRDIDETLIGEGQVAFWWLGQHSFVLKLCKTVVYLDPFLSEFPGRQVQPLVSPKELTNADIVIGSHDHEDHIDRPAWPVIAAASPESKFIVPGILLDSIAGVQKERLVGLDDLKSVELDGVKVTGIASAHEFLDQDPETGRYPHLGYVIESNGVTIYHPGDCCIYEGLVTKLKRWQFDIIFLPINGRDAKRYAAGCIGNMTYQEAADLAGALEPRLTVPAHFEMFAGNTEDPQLFVDYMNVKYPKLETIIPQHGERYVLSKTAGSI